MSYLLILLIGLVVLAVLFAAVFWVGLGEAGDPDESHAEDLSEFEKRHVRRHDLPPPIDKSTGAA